MNEIPDAAPKDTAPAARRTRAARSRANESAARANEIRPVQLPSHAPLAATADPIHAPGRTAPSDKHAKLIVPQDIAQHFVKVSERDYHFQNGEHAFTHHNDRLTTRSENAQLAATLVSILETNGARAIEVSGSARFRQRAWRAAVSAGLAVQGYTPTAFEKAKFQPEVPQATSSTLRPIPALATETAFSPAHAKGAVGELVIGELLDHGRAREGSDPRAAMSYYVRLATEAGERTLWGRDLERAMDASRTKPQVGNTIGVRVLARDQLLIKPSSLSSGTALETGRGQGSAMSFVVEKREFFAARAAAATIFRDHDIPSEKAIERYPILDGAYGLLDILADAATRDVQRPADRLILLASVREALAAHVERGEPMPTLRGLERSARAPAPSNIPPKLHEPRVLE